MAVTLCKCGCGNYLSDKEERLEREYKHGHKPKELRRSSYSKPKAAATTAVAEPKVTYPRMLRFAEVDLKNAEAELAQAQQDAYEATNRIAVAGVKIDKLKIFIEHLKPLCGEQNANNLSGRPNGGVHGSGGSQLAEPRNHSTEGEIPDPQPNGTGLQEQAAHV